MLTAQEMKDLKKLALQIRYNAFCAMDGAGFGHVGGSMSISDVLSVLYGRVMKYDAQNPQWDGRDYLVTSKGHSGPAVYGALVAKGFFPHEWLPTMNHPGTRLPSHTDRILTPGIDMTTGSLGQGLSLAVGAALALKLDKKPNRVFCIVGDGESQEGMIWESVMYAAQQKLNNLVVLVDDNGMQIDALTKDINNMEDYVAKFDAFNWNTIAVDGHDFQQLADAFEAAEACTDKPTAIVMHTIKGKGWAYAESIGIACHSMHVAPGTFDEILADLKAQIEAME